MKYFVYCRKSQEAEDRQVLSIESQLTTLRRTFASRLDIEIVDTYQEAFSAKAPGRARFNEMLKRIEKGEAEGIVAWAPDRLARNSIDGGRIVYLLDCGVIRDLKFSTYTFENNPQGKFMLQIMFGQSKYYSDALSENVKRGNLTKVEKGWRPSQAPLGYRSDKETKTTVPDPVHFQLIRQMYELMLTGAYRPKQIALIARDEWGFVTPVRKRIGGKPIQISSVHRILTNPFYAGVIEWDGRTYPGKHKPVVTLDEFKRVREILARPGKQRPKKHMFAFTGMIRCGGCGYMVTAEHKVKPSGRGYTYYHCTRRKLGPRCTEPAIAAATLEDEIIAFLEGVSIPQKIHRWAIEEVSRQHGARLQDQSAREQSLQSALTAVTNQLTELTGLRLRSLLSDEEFVRGRQELQQEQLRLSEQLSQKSRGVQLEPAEALISFSKSAAFCFRNGSKQQKRLILETVGSNPRLTNGKLIVEASKPFRRMTECAGHPSGLGFIEDVLTFARQDDPHSIKVFENLRRLEATVAEEPGEAA